MGSPDVPAPAAGSGVRRGLGARRRELRPPRPRPLELAVLERALAVLNEIALGGDDVVATAAQAAGDAPRGAAGQRR
jgi:hypothetical protein